MIYLGSEIGQYVYDISYYFDISSSLFYVHMCHSVERRAYIEIRDTHGRYIDTISGDSDKLPLVEIKDITIKETTSFRESIREIRNKMISHLTIELR